MITNDPWENIEERFKVGDTVEGTVAKEDKAGYYIELKDDVAGFIGSEDLPKGIKLKYHHKYKFVVKSVDKEKRRVVLKWQEEHQK